MRNTTQESKRIKNAIHPGCGNYFQVVDRKNAMHLRIWNLISSTGQTKQNAMHPGCVCLWGVGGSTCSFVVFCFCWGLAFVFSRLFSFCVFSWGGWRKSSNPAGCYFCRGSEGGNGRKWAEIPSCRHGGFSAPAEKPPCLHDGISAGATRTRRPYIPL